MFKEINLYDPTFSEKEIRERAFKAIDNNITNLFVPPYYLGKLSSLMSREITLSCPIDYPYGLGDTDMRQHSCISAINKGADFVDLMINPVYFTNCEKHKLADDIRANRNICADRGVNLRIILDYRMFLDGLIYTTSSFLSDLGITYIIPSTGQFVDDYTDNLIMCQTIMSKNPGVKTILNGVFFTQEQIDKAIKSKIYGLRFKSLNLVYNS